METQEKQYATFLQINTSLLRVGCHLSDIKSIDNGIPQRSVLNETLFLKVINDITSTIKCPAICRLVEDYLSISVSSNNPTRAHRFLQNVISDVTRQTSIHGCRFSPSKTKFLIFKNNNKVINFPTLILNRNQTQVSLFYGG